MEEIKVYKLENEFLKVELLNLGATIKKLEVKDKNGKFRMQFHLFFTHTLYIYFNYIFNKF